MTCRAAQTHPPSAEQHEVREQNKVGQSLPAEERHEGKEVERHDTHVLETPSSMSALGSS
eukprot:868515-Rhodomonas_salina.5